jgi:hypothetical protein
MGLLDNAGQKAVDDFLAAIPGISAEAKALILLLGYVLNSSVMQVGVQIENAVKEVKEALVLSEATGFDGVHGVIDRLDGTTLHCEVTLKLPPKK